MKNYHIWYNNTVSILRSICLYRKNNYAIEKISIDKNHDIIKLTFLNDNKSNLETLYYIKIHNQTIYLSIVNIVNRSKYYKQHKKHHLQIYPTVRIKTSIMRIFNTYSQWANSQNYRRGNNNKDHIIKDNILLIKTWYKTIFVN